MDIAFELAQTRGTVLLCASPAVAWVGPAYGASVAPGTAVGYAVLQQQDGGGTNPFAALEAPTCLVAKLAVAPSLQRRGIGRALLAAAIGHARATRASSCILHVDEANAPARALYASMGFAARGARLDDYYRPGRHALQMALDLDLVADPARRAAARHAPHRAPFEQTAAEPPPLEPPPEPPASPPPRDVVHGSEAPPPRAAAAPPCGVPPLCDARRRMRLRPWALLGPGAAGLASDAAALVGAADDAPPPREPHDEIRIDGCVRCDAANEPRRGRLIAMRESRRRRLVVATATGGAMNGMLAVGMLRACARDPP